MAFIIDASDRYGLRINFDKTKILTWDYLRAGCDHIVVEGQRVGILFENEAEKYLGRKLCFRNGHEVELRNRIASGWAAFHRNKGELCSNRYPLPSRVRLFEAMVSPAVLYGSATWALTLSQERELLTAWRKMLRFVFRLHRRQQGNSEDWGDYLQRTSREVSRLAEAAKITSWRRTDNGSGDMQGKWPA